MDHLNNIKQAFSQLHPLPEKEWNDFSPKLILKNFRKGYFLIREGEMDLLSLTAEERYARIMRKNPDLINAISVKHLSSYLGIQPESLSRIRKLHVKK